MALSDLSVFSEFAYTTMTEVLMQQIDLFNGASNGCIQLTAGSHMGDYSDEVFFKKISGIVKRRNAYGSGAQTPKVLQQAIDTMVKVAAGTVPVDLAPGQFKWIQMNPEAAGAALGQQIAVDTMADYLNTAVSAAAAALNGQAALVFDGTAGTMTHLALNSAASKFGDRATDIQAWVMHSKPMFDLFALGLTNSQQLFKYGTVSIVTDAFGRPFIITDAPGLTYVSTGTKYRTLGLVSGAITAIQNDDFTDNFQTVNGDENIQRTYQSEWTYQLGLKGFTWDKTNGGKSPNDAALFTATNWDKIVTDNKQMGGVVCNTQ